MGELNGGTVIVTGAGTARGVGNGQAIAFAAAAQGAAVLCVDLYEDRAERTATRIRDEGGRAETFVGDVTDRAATLTMVETALTALGGVTGLVNCVGVVSRNGLQRRVDSAIDELREPDLDDWELVLRANLTSAMLCTSAVLPHFTEQRHGAVVNIGSTVAGNWYGPQGGALAYATAKAGLEGLTLGCAGALGPFGVRVNLLVIGQVRAPHIDARAAMLGPEAGEQYLEGRRRSGLLHSDGLPTDVADAACFLLSPQARWITAQSLYVDAGAAKTMR